MSSHGCLGVSKHRQPIFIRNTYRHIFNTCSPIYAIKLYIMIQTRVRALSVLICRMTCTCVLIRLTNVRRDQLPTCHTVCFTPCDEYVCIKNTCVNKRESSLPICFSQRYIVEYFFEAHHCKLRRRRRVTIYFLIHACYLMVRFITSEHNRHTNHVGGIDLSGVSTITVQSIYSGDIREQLGGLIFQSFHFSS